MVCICSMGFAETLLKGSVDFTQRWIVTDNWTYTADISSYLDSISHQKPDATLLVFYGIDTVANIVRSFHHGRVLLAYDICRRLRTSP